MESFGSSSRAAAAFAAAALLSACAYSGNGSSNGTLPSSVNTGVRENAGTEQVLYSFSGGNDGGNAATGVALDRHGNLFGTTVVGGQLTCGTAFELAPQAQPPWKETVLYNFGCYADGKNPHGGVSFDPTGNLDGTTVAGGTGGVCASDGCGIVFQLKGTAEKVLHNFTAGKDGFGPGGAVVFDAAGDVFGTTPDGGIHSDGVVYEITHAGGRPRERVIHAFTGGKDGAVGSLGPLWIDSSGDLFGVAEEGGAHAAGTVFELSPGTSKSWSFHTLYAFKGSPDAASPYGGLVADSSGTFYGTTYYGGANGLGTVFALMHNARGGYRERVLYSFKGGSDGGSSTSTLAFGPSGDLYGTTSGGGTSCGCGVIFKVNPSTGKETALHAFAGGNDGAYSYYGMTQDRKGNFYGSTVAGGRFNQGTIFEYTP